LGVDGGCRAGVDLQPGAGLAGHRAAVGAGLAEAGHLPATAEVLFAAAGVFEMRAAQRRAMVETDITGAGKSDLAGHALHQFVQVKS
jgi:hypothetical protein